MQVHRLFRHPGALVLSGLLAGFLALPLAAATVDLSASDQAPAGRGAPLQQRFLEGGASIVTTAERRYCMVSRRIDIAASDYRRADGSVVPFGQVIRSPAASTQGMAGPEGLMGFRVQLKYSPDPKQPIVLTIGDAARDVAGLLEPSTDSLRLGGDLADHLAAAFRDGTPVRVAAISRGTGRRVGDVLAAPDMAALEACRAALAALPEAPLPPLSNQISLDFDASPSVETLATPEDYRTCGMTPADAPLYLGRIRATTGFYTHTDRIFVSFDDKGRLDRVYVPGLMDGGFAGGASGEVRVSQAADGNLPDAENGVTGCIGAAARHLCHIPQIGGPGHRLQVCDVLPAGDGLGQEIAAFDPLAGGGLRPGGGGLFTPSGGGGPGHPGVLSSGGGGGGLGDGDDDGDPGEGGGEGGGGTTTPPSPVPAPAAGLLLLAALGGMASLRRRKQAA